MTFKYNIKHCIPVTPQFKALELETIEPLEKLSLPPSEEFEYQKEEIRSYYNSTQEDSKTVVKPNAIKAIEFELSFSKPKLSRTRSKSFNPDTEEGIFHLLKTKE